MAGIETAPRIVGGRIVEASLAARPRTSPAAGRRLPSGPCVPTYRFRAMAPGSQTLEFAYRQTWEQGVPPAQVVRYDVTVKSAGWRNWF